MKDNGRLAIWNDCAAGWEEDYEDWYQSEHLFERLGVPGFRLGRRYRAVAAERTYFTYYETAGPETLSTPAYLERLENPTVWTQRMMSDAFTNMSRTVCACRWQVGVMRGAFAVTLSSADRLAEPEFEALLDSVAEQPSVARAELWVAAEDDGRPQSREEEMRGGDEKIAVCTLFETLREDDARELAACLEARLDFEGGRVDVYQLLCELSAEQLQR
ncbi:MAG: hypothetical protein QF578_18160 [Alphaproteobacteria bacterium]|jgi:hypothetical protein|nr:hypothetical protein [Alphaproteobacteria bacterium]MDP6566759.1 hypothetical protein [Alphaproteobacteria bacterium]MDP6812968.1 hypothetical protein [Alphaproteobacteria bacterium]